MATLSKLSAAILSSLVGVATAGSIADIQHVVLFMQENRAFDHYFGTMAGVRGFADSNAKYHADNPWKQLVNSGLTTATDHMTPWNFNYAGGKWLNATQCAGGGSNGWAANHGAYNKGANNLWATQQSPYSLAFFERADIPVQFSLADNYLVGDMYQESVVSSTNPNRAFWASGSINVPRGPQTSDQGGNPYIDNSNTPGCESGGINCYPLKWLTAPEHYEAAGVSWSAFQDSDNFDDNPLVWFQNFQKAAAGSSLNSRGVKGQSLANFYAQAAAGTLPAVSYIVGPTQLSEHPPYSPRDGAWLQEQVAQAVINSPAYNNTVLMVSYGETGGWFDHVSPYTSPNGTAGEWLQDPYGSAGYIFAGPGYRLPFYIISPWTRNGGVFTEHADHASQILFIEQWQAALGKNVTTNEINPWRRQHMSNLVAAFNFENPKYSKPTLPVAAAPHKNSAGSYDGSSYCASLYGNGRPPVPYTGEANTANMATVVEKGFKQVRGALTEGRTLVFEASGYGLGYGSSSPTQLVAASKHDDAQQQWVIEAVAIGGHAFRFRRASDGMYICNPAPSYCSDSTSATVINLTYTPGLGHYLTLSNGRNVTIDDHGLLTFNGGNKPWSVYSVNY